MGAFFVQLFALFQGLILRPLIWLWPLKWTVIKPQQAAVRFTLGKPHLLTSVGWHPGVTGETFRREHIARRLAPTEMMQVFTADGVPMVADAIVTYRIRDLIAFLTEAEDAEAYLMEWVETALRETIQEATYQALLTDIRSAPVRMKEALKVPLSEIGVSVRKCRIQNLAHDDPLVRAACGAPVAAQKLAEAIEQLRTAQSDLTPAEALCGLSTGVQFVHAVAGQPTLGSESSPTAEEPL